MEQHDAAARGKAPNSSCGFLVNKKNKRFRTFSQADETI